MLNLKEGYEPDPPVTCDKCGKPMVIKAGKFGLFLACSGYPECENTRELETPEAGAEGEASRRRARTAASRWSIKRGRFGQFLACTGYPECKTTRKIIATKQGMTAAKPDQILDEKCPKCELEPRAQAGALRRVHRLQQLSDLQVREAEDRPASSAPRTAATSSNASRGAARCSSAAPTIRTATSRCGTGRSPEKCPDCGAPFLVEKITKRHGRQLICNNEECSYVRSEELAPA